MASHLSLFGRILTALLGSYALAVAIAIALARLLPGERAEAVVTASLVAVIAMPAAVIWTFGVRRAWLAIGGIAVAIGLFALLGWLAGAPA